MVSYPKPQQPHQSFVPQKNALGGNQVPISALERVRLRKQCLLEQASVPQPFFPQMYPNLVITRITMAASLALRLKIS